MGEQAIGVLVDAVGALAAFLLAFLVLRLGTAQYTLLAPRDAESVPLLQIMAVATGLSCGIALVAAAPQAGDFQPGLLFAPDGPWMMGVGTFLGTYGLPNAETIGRTLRAVDARGPKLAVAAARLTLLCALCGIVIGLVWWRGGDRLRAVIGFVVLAAWTALFVHYVAHLAAWSAAQLNFWLFAVALILFQRARYRAKGTAH